MEIQNQLDAIFIGMAVFDVRQDCIGSVYDIYFGSDMMLERVPEMEPLKAELAAVMGGIKFYPSAIYSRIYRQGFVRVEHGFSQPDFIVMPQQIARVDADSVYLNVPHEELLIG